MKTKCPECESTVLEDLENEYACHDCGHNWKPRFFLSQDDSSHWYMVPANKRIEWEEWTSIDENDERAWTAPDYASAIGGSPSQVEFEKPKATQ